MIAVLMLILVGAVVAGLAIQKHLRKQKLAEYDRMEERIKNGSIGKHDGPIGTCLGYPCGKDLCKRQECVKLAAKRKTAQAASKSPVPETETVSNQEAVPAEEVDWTPLSATLHTQIDALGQAYITSRDLCTLCKDHEYNYQWALRELSSTADLPFAVSTISETITKAGEPFKTLLRCEKVLQANAGNAKIATRTTKECWESLATTLKNHQINKQLKPNDAPLDALAAINAAIKAKEYSERSIKRQCETVEARITIPALRRKGPSARALGPALGKLSLELRETLAFLPTLYNKELTAGRLAETAKQFGPITSFSSDSVTFGQPVKPTQEEVARYLKEIADWASNRLAAHRIANQAIADHEQVLAAFKEQLDQLSSLVNRLSPLLSKQLDEETFAKIGSANRLFKALLNEYHREVNSARSHRFDKLETSLPVLVTTPEEQTQIDQIQQVARLLGFAAAQRTVAEVKYTTARTKRKAGHPSEPDFIDKESSFTVDDYIGQHKQRLLDIEAANQLNEAQSQEATRLYSAMAARKLKVESCKDQLAGVVAKIQPQLTDSISDELRLAITAADKLFWEQSRANR